MQEGVTSEASSLAGHQKLGNLVVLYDSNQISIEDDTKIAFTEDLEKRYESYGWHVQVVNWRKSGKYHEDMQELFDAIEKAKAETGKPSLITIRTIIGWPAPTKQNTGKVHGSALGAEELAGLKTVLGFDPAKNFDVAKSVVDYTRGFRVRSKDILDKWESDFQAWRSANPDNAALFDRLEGNELPDIEAVLPVFEAGTDVSTRASSGRVLNAIAKIMPELWGGSADLAESNNTTIAGANSFVPAVHSTHEFSGDPQGRVLHFGIREHAMGSILNGISLHGKTRSYGGTFLIFSDYMRPAVRLAALMKVPSIFVWTHDSIALGEDGPTHQPIEQLATLRAIPGLDIVRPADANEVSFAWKKILSRRLGPAGIALTRQNVPVIERGKPDSTGQIAAAASHVEFGGYVLVDASNQKPELILIATGSEVQLALAARLELEKNGVRTRVVSMPCVEWFEEQTDSYRESVLPANVQARVSVEAGLALGWSKYVPQGASVSIEHYGASADYKTLFTKFGITTEAVVARANQVLGRNI
jgi:transketolase